MPRKSPELDAAQTVILRVAQRLANASMREEFSLPPDFNPLIPDPFGKSGLGLKLDLIKYPMMRQTIRDKAKLLRIEEIVTESIRQAVLKKEKVFVQSMLDDLFSDKPFYKVKTR